MKRPQRPLPLMDYSDTLAVEGGPLQVQPMATSAPPSNMPTAPVNNFGYSLDVAQPPNFAAPAVMPNNIQGACKMLRPYEDWYRGQGVDMTTFYNFATAKLRSDGFFGGPNDTYQNTCRKSPLENEIVQYGLLFLLAYVVIKKL